MAPDSPLGDQGHPNLPAVYRSPWGALRDDFQAAWADLGLRLQELWRRNRQGSLWRPRWWSVDLAPLFWPLLLAAALGLLLAAALLLRSAVPTALPQPQASLQAPQSALSPELSPEPEAVIAPEPEPELESEPLSQLELEPEPEPPAPPADQPAGPSPVVEADPLELLLQGPEAEGLLAAGESRPEQGTLVLQVTPAFAALSAADQQRRAEQWQQWAMEQGYDHLELRDSRSGLLARDALVGAGLIVLGPTSQP